MNRKEIDEIESFLKQLSEETDFEFELKLIRDWTELYIVVYNKLPDNLKSSSEELQFIIRNYNRKSVGYIQLFDMIKAAVKSAAKVDEDMDVLSEELENIQVNHILTKMLFKEVIILNNDLVNNKICNLNISPAAVLYNTMKDNTDFTYSSNELFEIYKKTVDEEAFEQMFKLFTGITFYEYLKKCKEVIDQQDTGLIL